MKKRTEKRDGSSVKERVMNKRVKQLELFTTRHPPNGKPSRWKKNLSASDSGVLKTKGGGGGLWIASIHTPCLPVPLHHAQNVNHFSLQFSKSLV